VTSDLLSFWDQITFHKQIRDLGTCHIVRCYTISNEYFWDCHVEFWSLGQAVQNCCQNWLLPHVALPATVTLSIKDVRRWNDDRWRELYTVMGARGRMYTPSTVNVFLYNLQPTGFTEMRPNPQKTEPSDCLASEYILVWAEFWKGWAWVSFPGCLVWKRGYQPKGNWTVRVSLWGGAKDDKDWTCLTNCNNHIIVHTSFLHSKPLYSRGFQISPGEHSSVAWLWGSKYLFRNWNQLGSGAISLWHDWHWFPWQLATLILPSLHNSGQGDLHHWLF